MRDSPLGNGDCCEGSYPGISYERTAYKYTRFSLNYIQLLYRVSDKEGRNGPAGKVPEGQEGMAQEY